MIGGIAGRILHVNLSTNSVVVEETKREVVEKLIGGYGYAAWIFYNYWRKEGPFDAFSGKNPLIFMTGPLTGVSAFGAKACVASRSPVTRGFSWSVFSGCFGVSLKKAGFDGIVVTGKAERPVYIVVDEGRIEVRDAEHLWGRDTFEVFNYVQKVHGRDFKAIAIGPAGENLVKMAAIVTSERRVAARTGLGAVMGYKKLKAIVVRGSKHIKVYDESVLAELNRAWLTRARQTPRGRSLSDYGTAAMVSIYMATGGLPIKNWTLYAWSGSEKLTGQYIMDKYGKGPRRRVCGEGVLCSIACERVVEYVDERFGHYEGKGPEYESIAGLGLMTMISDPVAVIKLNELCDKLGLDTISTGAVVAWAMEAYEKGAITKEEAGGLELKWGSVEAALKLVENIAYRRGLGALLAEGVKKASEVVGRGSERYALHVKGVEVPYHDPRLWKSMGLVYATSNRGACHLQGMTYHVDRGALKLPEYGIEGPPKTSAERVKAVIVTQNLCAFLDSAGLCKFGTLGVVDFDFVAKVWSAATGIELDKYGVLRAGERIWYMARFLNYTLGLTNHDDALPARFIEEPVKEGPGAGSVCDDFAVMLELFYRERGLESSENFVKKLAETGLLDLLGGIGEIRVW